MVDTFCNKCNEIVEAIMLRHNFDNGGYIVACPHCYERMTKNHPGKEFSFGPELTVEELKQLRDDIDWKE